jgi:RNA polymerase sigma-70 factor (ECF subfamily)
LDNDDNESSTHWTTQGDPAVERETFNAALTTAVTSLRPYARRWCPDRASAEDLLQKAAERALRRREKFRLGTNATAWVRRIIRNIAIDQIRRSRHLRRLEASYHQSMEDAVEPIDDVPAGETPRPGVDDLRRAAEQLDEPRRTLFLLRLNENLSYKELSARTELPLGTISSSLGRARRIVEGILRHGAVPHQRGGSRRMRRSCSRR